MASSIVATILPTGETTFLDQNGSPLAGGTVTFYIPNTSTLKTTWQNPTAATPNSNPVVLDSAGRALIYGEGQYRQVVRDQYGNLIWDQLTQDILGLLGTAAYENIGPNLKDDGAGNLVSKITTPGAIVAAATTDLGTLTTDVITVTGSGVTITSFGASANVANPIYFLTFSGNPLLTNSSSLILPSGANIQAAPGDTAIFQYNGSGNWECLTYQTASGKAIVPPVPSPPNVQLFITPGSGTYVTPAGTTYLVVEMAGGGGGGAGSGTGGGGSSGGGGGNTEFHNSIAGGGTGATGGIEGGAPGGTTSTGSGDNVIIYANGGGGGGAGISGTGDVASAGGDGGNSYFGAGAPGGGVTGSGADGQSFGGGGSGGGGLGPGVAGCGGGAGGYLKFYITSPASTYAYIVGAAGGAGGPGSGGSPGGNGGAGVILVLAY